MLHLLAVVKTEAAAPDGRGEAQLNLVATVRDHLARRHVPRTHDASFLLTRGVADEEDD